MNVKTSRSRIAPALAALLAVAACADAPEELSFVAIGDMGTGGPGQKRIAASIAERARAEPIDFVLTLGDNFYPAGVLSVDDPQWTSTIEDVYADHGLRVPFHATLGNHDHQGFPLEQVAYSAVSDRWSMPAPYYLHTRVLADGTEVAFFALDTDGIRGGMDGRRDPASAAALARVVRRELARLDASASDDVVRHIADLIHPGDDFTVSRIAHLARRTGRPIDERLVAEAIAASVPEDYEAQLAWLDRALSASDARWKIVYGHHPLFGHQPERGHQWAMIERVEPILVRHGVDLYLAGHDHLTDLMRPVKGVHYVTSGGGAGDDHPYPIDETDESYYIGTDGGFTLLRVTPDRIEVEAVDIDGVTRHTLIFAK
jgi:3',5'-cyclic AMP phosphodiesterase CpdA